MSATVTWIGLKELMAELKKLPQDLTELGEVIVREAADRAAADVKAAYPVGPGNDEHDGGALRKGVRVGKQRKGSFAVGYVVRSTAPHASIFENGTQTRQTKLGYNRGFMPGSNIFVPIMVRGRREMYEDLTALLEQAGLEVRR